MSEQDNISVSSIIAFLNGEHGNIDQYIQKDPDLVSRCIIYTLDKKYHRKNMCKSILLLINSNNHSFRGVGWVLLQKIKLSHLMELDNLINKKNNTKRLRHAIATKIATSTESEIIYSFFMATNNFRNLFEKMYLPTTIIDNEQIKNKNYLLAAKLSKMSIQECADNIIQNKSDLILKYNLPLEKVMQFLSTDDIIELAKNFNHESYFHHGRWIKSKIGLELFESIGIEKIKGIKNPFKFLLQKDHLIETDSITPQLIEKIEELSKNQIEELMKNMKLEKIALIVDTSGSMENAVRITKKLYNGMKQIKFTDVIEFNTIARNVDPKNIENLRCMGSTSCGSSIMLLSQNIVNRKMTEIPQAIIMITDLEENHPPRLKNTIALLKEIGNPPLIILKLGRNFSSEIVLSSLNFYPHSIIPTHDFHPGLIQEIVANIAKITSVLVNEKEITNIVIERNPIDEIIGGITVYERPKYTLFPQYLKGLLTSESGSLWIDNNLHKYKNKEEISEQINRIVSIASKISINRLSQIIGVNDNVIKQKIRSIRNVYINENEIIFARSIDGNENIAEVYFGPECEKCGYVNDSKSKICEYCGSSL